MSTNKDNYMKTLREYIEDNNTNSTTTAAPAPGTNINTNINTDIAEKVEDKTKSFINRWAGQTVQAVVLFHNLNGPQAKRKTYPSFKEMSSIAYIRIGSRWYKGQYFLRDMIIRNNTMSPQYKRINCAILYYEATYEDAIRFKRTSTDIREVRLNELNIIK